MEDVPGILPIHGLAQCGDLSASPYRVVLISFCDFSLHSYAKGINEFLHVFL